MVIIYIYIYYHNYSYVCVYICMCIYMYIYIYNTHTHIYIIRYDLCNISVIYGYNIYIYIYIIRQLLVRMCVYMYIYTHTHMYSWVQFNTELHHAGTWSAEAWPPSRLRYRPTIFFRQLRLIALKHPQGKIRRTFKKCHCLHSPPPKKKYIVNLKLHYMEMRESGWWMY